MISACDYKLRVRLAGGKKLKSLDHEFESFVGTPFSEGKNAMFRITPSREIRQFRPPGEYSVRPQMDVVATIFIIQDFAIAGHEHRHGIRE